MFRMTRLLSLTICLCFLAGCNSEKDAPSADERQGQAELVPDNEKTTDEEKNPVPKLSKLEKQYEPIVEVLSLTDDEAAVFSKIHKHYGDALSKWNQTDGKEMRSLQRQALQAARNRDRAALNQLNAAGAKEKVAKFSAAEQSIQKEYSDALLDAVPDDQLNRWKAYRIAVNLLDFLAPLKLTDEQLDAVRDFAPKAIQSIGNESNWQGYGTSKLEKLFESNILSADQKDEFEMLKSKNKLRLLKWNN